MAPGGLLDDAIGRAELAEHVGKSGAALERVTLADGRTVVVKRITPATDLTQAFLGQPVAQELLLWQSGGLDRLPEGVGHAILDGWTEGEDTTVLVMRDLGDTVLGWDDRLDARTCRWVLERVAALHRAYLGDPPDAVVPLAPALGLFAPDRIAGLADAGDELLAAAMRGWDYFADPALVPTDVSDAVFALHADVRPLVDGLREGPVTLAHGDLATVNLALPGEELVLLDWAMPVAAPGALDVARLLVGCGHVIDLSPDEVIAAYAAAAGPAYDEGSMRLALLSALCWLGWNKALDIVESDEDDVRQRERASLAWWIGQAREAIERGAG
ncbi:hypothetical protein [Nocardioides euryhalodurans]|uniref:Aminoglycoside phosphotransferase domain-containing protein n=1 Tax=Nocardioides euryhalodurans TaxID=2518370 RepID=A0A4P7GN31_9ACTN|nr:hypothetical protein [Nocardioides euryhalodurans]QBR93207.1 hypothetical protein EXE57_13740 [Nocardioides euryhalodurans]